MVLSSSKGEFLKKICSIKTKPYALFHTYRKQSSDPIKIFADSHKLFIHMLKTKAIALYM